MNIPTIAQRKLLILFLALGLLLPLQANAEKYIVGVVPQFEARRIHQIWAPILEHLQKETGHEFELLATPTIPEFETEFLAGRFDLLYLNPYHLIMANDSQGYVPLVRDVARQLYGVLVSKKDGPIQTVQDLQGKVLAFPAPNALGASLQMRQELHDLFGLSFTARYVKTHDSAYLNVILNQAAAGGGVQKTFNRQDQRLRDQLKIIHKTKPVAPHPIAAHPRIDAAVREQITATLVAYGESEQGKAQMSKIPMRKAGRADLADYQILREMNLERFYVKSQ